METILAIVLPLLGIIGLTVINRKSDQKMFSKISQNLKKALGEYMKTKSSIQAEADKEKQELPEVDDELSEESVKKLLERTKNWPKS